jgi:hypothetical protein
MEANDFRIWIQHQVGASLNIDPKTIHELVSNPVTVGEVLGNTTTIVHNDPSVPITPFNEITTQQEAVVSTDSTESVSTNVIVVENAPISGNHTDKMVEQTKTEESQLTMTLSSDKEQTKAEESQLTMTSSSPTIDAMKELNQNDDETVISHHNNNDAMDNDSHLPLLLSLPATFSQRLTHTLNRISESFSSYSSWEEMVVGTWFATNNNTPHITNNETSLPSSKRVRMTMNKE